MAAFSERMRRTASRVRSLWPIRPRARRLFANLKTDQAKVYLVRFRGNRAILRVPRNNPTREKAVNELVRRQIFNEIFPQYAVRPLGTMRLPGNIREKWGVASEILRGRSKDYKRYIDWYYKSTLQGKKDGPHSGPAAAHNTFAKSEPVIDLIKQIAEYGIIVNDHPANIALAGGKPKFFEVDQVDTKKLKRNLPLFDGNTRERLEEMIRLLPIRNADLDTFGGEFV